MMRDYVGRVVRPVPIRAVPVGHATGKIYNKAGWYLASMFSVPFAGRCPNLLPFGCVDTEPAAANHTTRELGCEHRQLISPDVEISRRSGPFGSCVCAERISTRDRSWIRSIPSFWLQCKVAPCLRPTLF